MGIITLQKRPGIDGNGKWQASFDIFERLLLLINQKEPPAGVVEKINAAIEYLNAFQGHDRDYMKALRKSQFEILSFLEKDLKWVPVNYYRNRWLALGMAVFGIPLGVAMGLSLGSMAFIGIGLPFGIAIGIAIGTDMDKKAKAAGKQLDIDIKS
ncbi:MAG: hypothetical protein GC171_11570 [Terrimonas sp.]|nr:hypothetical protein [Terrimonas sp.]